MKKKITFFTLLLVFFTAFSLHAQDLPTEATFSPPNESNLLPIDQIFTVTFNEIVQMSDNQGSIYIFNLLPGGVRQP